MGGAGLDPAELLAHVARLEGRLRDVEVRLAAVEGAETKFRQALTSLGAALADTHDRPRLVRSVLETTVVYLEAEAGVFYEIVAGSDRLRPMATFGVLSDLGDLARGEGVAGAAAVRGEVVAWSGALPGAEIAPGSCRPAPVEPGLGRGPAVAVPVRSDTHLFGVLALYGPAGAEPFSTDDVETLQTLVRQAENALENSFLFDEAKHLSLTDGLTGVWNDRDFELRLSERLSEAERFGDPFSLVLADLDGFKGINDTYGHQTGNSVLVEFSRRLMESTREVDRVFRLSGGGDEFALLLPRTGLAGALRLAEKVRAAVADAGFTVEGAELRVTMSLGVATHPEHGRSEKELKAAADAALYRAKRSGGNRVGHFRIGELGQPGGGQ
ncbi:MAG TPA: sensor domain-containing diguanylate cyclase [Acidimicrobiales bacterium]|nr:sensor domain-containing diguanylate cyclase [Acidimicrobiales bacterium]